MRADKMSEAKKKAGKYCAYQERTQQEVRNKLYSYGLCKNEVEDVLSQLISENFVNEGRFAKTYAIGKFRSNKWGRKKIAYMLNQKGLSANCIEEAINEIGEEQYKLCLQKLISSRIADVATAGLPEKHKAAKYLISKGYEPDLVWAQLNE